MINVLFLAEGLIFSFIFFIIFKYGYRNHLALLFVSATMIVFMFFSPMYGYITHFTTLFNNYLWDYYPVIVLNYLVAVTFFLLGYLLFSKESKFTSSCLTFNNKNNDISANLIRIGLLIGVASFIIWGITSGKSLSNIFLLNFFGSFDSSTYSNELKDNKYLLLIIEIFLPLLTLALFSKMKKTELIIWLLLVIVIFLSQGFRYRFILLLSSFLLVYLHYTKLSLQKVLLIGGIFLIFMGAIIEISNYRNSIRDTVRQGYLTDKTIGDDRDIANIIFSSTRNYLAFGSLLKYMDNHNIPYGYGETMFGHIFIRLVPSFFFEKNIKPRPPSLEISARSWGSIDALNAGEAYGGVGGVYFEFGIIGVSMFFLLLGIITRWLDKKISSKSNNIKFVFYIIITVSLFKIITRGYLPEFFFTFGFMMLPFIYIKIFLPKLWSDA